jgi:hypothetical protein
MPTYETLKHQLIHISEDTAHLLDDAERITEFIDEGLSQWRATCQTISGQISEEIMRVAVVGPIKSGKSTFVNTLFGGDYLKRGAGVVTSIVTRVRSGSRLRAILYLKNWEAVNRDIGQASVLLPAHDRSQVAHPFDIRQDADRRVLSRALNDLAADQLISNDTRSAGSVLLASYLHGYERIQHLVGADHATVVFENDRFTLHRDFVGDDAMAVYLKDVLLEIDTSGLGQEVEVADCQGSDSPNPLHLAMIQDYLMMAHLTIYVISSRTGLRQADIRFLTMIRKMGILEAVVFVINCDFSEHESLADITDGIGKIEADLRLICSDPRVFTFSALFSLMSQIKSDLSSRDKDRYQHWLRESEMVDFAAREQTRLDQFLDQQINRERSRLLLKNHLERLEIVASGIGHWIEFNRDLLARDANGAQAMADRAHHQRGRLDRLKQTVKSALDGALNQIKGDLKSSIDRFFDKHADGVVDGVIRFIRSYRVEMQGYDESLKTAGFAKTLYLVFQEFKQALDAHMAEVVNPQVLRFVRGQEQKLIAYLEEIAGPYGAMIDDALAQYTAAMDENSQSQPRSFAALRIGPDLETICNRSGLSLPPAAATMRYSTQIKTEAVMRFGFYKFVNLVKKALKKSADKYQHEQYLALASGIKRMKRETERSILFHLKDYRENLKFQYIMKLADAAADALYSQLLERFQHHGADLSRLAALMGEQRLDKEAVSASLDQMAASSQLLQEKIGHLKADLQKLDD